MGSNKPRNDILKSFNSVIDGVHKILFSFGKSFYESVMLVGIVGAINDKPIPPNELG